MNTKKRIMVDMSATLIHHGHIRLLEKASKLGKVIVALTSDEDIEKVKGYPPELSYEERKEILSAIKFVDEVVKTGWDITEDYLDKHDIDYLDHGNDNANKISEDKLIIFPRTEGISSASLRERVLQNVQLQKKN